MMDVNVFDIQHFCVQDGPGIRTGVFMKDCPLSCKWCHNPESQAKKTVLMYYEDKCTRCGRCANACTKKVHILSPEHSLLKENCMVCGKCAKVCMENALRMAGQLMSFEAVLQEIRKDRMFHEESGGGVTFTGGEPFAQSEVLQELLIQCAQEQIHTAVETSAYAKQDIFLQTAEYADLMICDIKAVDTKLHRELTGVDNQLILENIKALDKIKPGAYWVRIPLIPGYNDSDEELAKMAEFLLKLYPQRIEVLPYHDSGRGKYTALNILYACEETEQPGEAWKHHIKHFFEALGVSIIL